MKPITLPILFAGLLLCTFLITSCEKEPISTNSAISIRADQENCSTVTLTYPGTVGVDEEFTIDAEVSCGKIAIEQAYIDVDGENVYTGLSCDTEDLLWEEVVTFQCYTDDASAPLSLGEAGVYVFRTKHNGADGNCDGLGGSDQSGKCSFNGNNFCCFTIEVTGCENSLTSELTCDDETECGRWVTFTFVPAEDGSVVIQGGLTNNTEICSMTATGGLTGVVRDSPNQANVTTWTGEVSACETYTITINWTRFASPSGNVDAEALGEWTAVLNGVEVAVVDEQSCE